MGDKLFFLPDFFKWKGCLFYLVMQRYQFLYAAANPQPKYFWVPGGGETRTSLPRAGAAGGSSGSAERIADLETRVAEAVVAQLGVAFPKVVQTVGLVGTVRGR